MPHSSRPNAIRFSDPDEVVAISHHPGAAALARALGAVLSAPGVARFVLEQRLLGSRRALKRATERLALIPGDLGVHVRRAFYRRVLAEVGPNVHIGFMTVFSKMEASLEADVYLGRFCSVGWVHFGRGAKIADGVQLLSGSRHHVGLAGIVGGDAVHYTPIRIGCGAWIGAGAIIMADVGPGAVVAAGAVVTRPVAAAERVAGVPARPMRVSSSRTAPVRRAG
jgi:acetyltransferase-like isoleucine patch superfamily enzyme